MLFIVTPFGRRDRFRIFSISAKTSLRECSGCGGTRIATSLPRGVLPMRSPRLARLISSENLPRTTFIVNLIVISAYLWRNHSAELSTAKFGDHCFAAAKGDGVYAIQNEDVRDHGNDGQHEEYYSC
jgi:hypothetical protein